MRSIQQYSKRPNVDTWLPYEDQGDADPLPGSWYIKKPDPRCPEPALSFKQVRLNLIATKRSPVVFKAGGRINLMVFKSRVPGVENTYITSVPYYFDELKAVAKVLGVPYIGTNVGTYALSAIVHHLREPRVAVSSSEREQLLRNQHFSCNLCEKTLDRTKVEVDHIHPVHCSLTDAKLQILCVECHAKKTGEQGRHDISITSHLSDELWGVFEENPVALAVVLRVGDPGKREAHYVDTIRCRTEILKGSSHDWPIFLPHDRVEAVEPGSLELGDFCYVAHKCPETVLEGGQRTLDSNWDADKIVQSLPLRGPGWYHRCAVEAALEFGVIGWDSVTQRITASARVPKERFGEAARRVLDALPAHLQKEAANHAIGLMVPKSLAKYKVLSSSNPEDAMTLDGVVHAATVHGTNVVDYTVEQPVLTRQTQKPLYLKIIHEEATQLARRMRSLRCTRIYELNTDSILYEGEPPMLDPRIRYKRTREERLKGDWKLPVLNHPAPKPPVFVDLDEAQALEHLLDGGSLYLEGLAGTGKSYFLRRAREALQAQGKEVRCVAKTYVGAANIGGETLDRFTHSFGGGKKTRVDVLIVDEISLVDAYLWTYVASMRTVIPQIVLAGDWEQLPPPANEYLGFAVRSMRGAPMLAQLGARLVLRECRRSDAALYSLYHGLIGSPRPIAEDVAAMKAALPNIPGHCKINLVQRHCHRIQLNERLQHYYAPKDAVLLKKSEVQIGPSESQDILLYPGLQLLSVVNTKGLRNMWTYTVDSVDEHVCLHDDRGAYKVHSSMITELFRPAFARTYFAAQGLTFERVRLWGYTSPFYTHAHLITGLSRCTTAAGVDFGLY